MSIIDDIKAELPKTAMISESCYEGSEIIFYTKDKEFFRTSSPLIKKIVNKFKKRIEIRADPGIVMDEEKTIELIKSTVPNDAGIKDIYFEPEFSKVVIHAEKPGLVIGKNGETLSKIKEKALWMPEIRRAPVIDSEIIRSIRRMLHRESSYRKKFLNELGKKIYSPSKDVEWIRFTALGGFREVGRSCVLLQTPQSTVMLDCGINIGSVAQKPFPYLDAPEFHIQDLDAVVVSHAHLDHCLHPETLVQMSDGSIKQIKEVETNEKTPALDFKYSMDMHNMHAMQRGGIKSPKKIYEVRTSTKRIKATGNHPLFVLEDGEVKIRHIEKIRPGDFIATPRYLEIDGKKQDLPDFPGMPVKIDENFAQMLGYMLGDGNAQGLRTVCFTDKSLKNIQFYSDIIKLFGLNPKIKIKERNRLLVHSVNFRRFLNEIEPSMLAKSKKRKIPQTICRSPKNIVASFLKGLYDAEGSVKHHSVVLCTTSEHITQSVQLLLLRFGIISHVYDQDNSKSTFGGGIVHQIAISHPASLKIFEENIGFSDIKKRSKLEKVVENSGQGISEKTDIIPIRLEHILKIVEELGLRKIDLRNAGFHYYHYKTHFPSKGALTKLVDYLESVAKKQNKKSLKLTEFANLVRSPILWDPVKEIRVINSDTEDVYDLTIPGHSNYIANGIFVHNCGLLPYLYEYGYRGPLYSTRPNRDLMTLLQLDYIQICQRENKKPPYTSKGIEEMLKHCVTLEYGEVSDITPDMRLTLQNAGHIMGSATTHIHIGDGLYNVLYSGDIKYENTKLFERTSTDYSRVESLIIESTYGSQEDLLPSHVEGERQLVECAKRALARGGRAVIPSFAVGRAQDVITMLVDSDIDAPIYLDGMLWDATAIHTAYPEFMAKAIQTRILHKGRNPFVDPRLKGIGSQKERREVLDSTHPCVVLATSGMLAGGPVMEYLQNFADDEKNMLIFVGYQAEGTLGRRIQKGWKQVQLESGKSMELKLEIETIQGLSGHSDHRQLLEFIGRLPRPKRVFTNHGESIKCVDLARTVHKIFKIETDAPKVLETIRLK